MLKVKNFNFDALYQKTINWLILYTPRIVAATLLSLIGFWLINVFVKKLHTVFDRRKVDPSLKPFLLSLIQVVMQLLLFLAIMQVLQVRLTLFASLVAAIGVATGLALSGTLQNFTSGIIILLLKPYRVGDSIIAQGKEGVVESIQIFYTVVTTYDNLSVIFPNSKLSNEVIVNITREGSRRLDVELKFSYGNEFEKLKSIIQTSLRNMQFVNPTPEHRIGIKTLEPDGYRIVINVWTNAHGFEDVKMKFQEQLINDLKANGIMLPGM